MQNPLINILTRTSNRPNGFKRNYDSVHNQTYKNIRHIVSYDNDLDLSYLNLYDNIDLIKINRDELINNDNCVNPNTGKYSPHNLYFNHMVKNISDGWVIYLDDDDTFAHPMVIEQIVNEINKIDEDTLIIWRFKLGTSLLLPMELSDEIPPSIGKIGGSCIAFNIKYKDYAVWDSWKCSDFRVIDRLFKNIPKYVFIKKTYVLAPIPGSGDKIDLKI